MLYGAKTNISQNRLSEFRILKVTGQVPMEKLFKNVLEKRHFFDIFDSKNVEKTAFFKHIFEKCTISHDIVWPYAFENFESTSR